MSAELALMAEFAGLAHLDRAFYDASATARDRIGQQIASTIRTRAARGDGAAAAFLRKHRHLADVALAAPEVEAAAVRPHGIRPSIRPPVVLSIYKSPPNPAASIGLGVNAALTVATLRKQGIPADVIGCAHPAVVEREIAARAKTLRLVVIESIAWPGPEIVAGWADRHPGTLFVLRCHSQVAFLQIEPTTIAAMRRAVNLSLARDNFRLAGNSPRFTEWAAEAWGAPVVTLPNLYPILPLAERPPRDEEGPLRLATFGAMRIQKHHTVATAAAVIVAQRLGREVELHVNGDSEKRGGSTLLEAVRAMIADVPGVQLVEVPWQTAPQFRETVAGMDLCFQLSATETFNLVTADAAAAEVPSVVGESIEWTPRDWCAPVDDPRVAAEVAIRLLADPTAGPRGRAALQAAVKESLAIWRAVIDRN